MPRRGSREWNRQQNIRRQREQTIMAQMVEPVIIESAETVIIEATEYDQTPLRQKISELEQQISNKTTQINQLKQNSKEYKKVLKTFERENKKLADVLSTPYELIYSERVEWGEKNTDEDGNELMFGTQTVLNCRGGEMDGSHQDKIFDYIRKLEKVIMCNRQTQNMMVELCKAEENEDLEKRKEDIKKILCKSIIKSHLNDNGILERQKNRIVEVWAKGYSSIFQEILQEEEIECDIDVVYY